MSQLPKDEDEKQPLQLSLVKCSFIKCGANYHIGHRKCPVCDELNAHFTNIPHPTPKGKSKRSGCTCVIL